MQYKYMTLRGNEITGVIQSASVVESPDVVRLSPNGLYVNPANKSYEPVIGHTFDADAGEITPPVSRSMDDLRAEAVRQVKQQAKALIEGLSWRVERLEEQKKLVLLGEKNSTDDPEWKLLGLRDSIRKQSNSIEAAIASAVSPEALQALDLSIHASPTLTPPRYTKLTRMAFLARFSGDEYKAVKTSTSGDVMLLATMLETASYIDVSDSRTVNGISALALMGILSGPRKDAILADGTESEAIKLT